MDIYRRSLWSWCIAATFVLAAGCTAFDAAANDVVDGWRGAKWRYASSPYVLPWGSWTPNSPTPWFSNSTSMDLRTAHDSLTPSLIALSPKLNLRLHRGLELSTPSLISLPGTRTTLTGQVYLRLSGGGPSLGASYAF